MKIKCHMNKAFDITPKLIIMSTEFHCFNKHKGHNSTNVKHNNIGPQYTPPNCHVKIFSTMHSGPEYVKTWPVFKIQAYTHYVYYI
jgi:hypothetical protein